MRIIDRIKEKEFFTPTENLIAQYIQENSRDVVNMPLDQLAEKLYVSKSTIIRFCKKLGFHGHKELCVQIAKEMGDFLASDVHIDTALPLEHFDDRKVIADKMMTLNFRSISETYNSIDLDLLYGIAKSINEKKTICIYAMEEDFIVAQDLQKKFLNIGIHCTAAQMPGMALSLATTQTASSVALFLSYYGNETLLLQAARILKEKNIPIELITGPQNGNLNRFASHICSVGYYEPMPKIASIGSRTAMLFAADILYSYLFSLEFEKNMNTIRMNEELRRKSVN